MQYIIPHWKNIQIPAMLVCTVSRKYDNKIIILEVFLTGTGKSCGFFFVVWLVVFFFKSGSSVSDTEV